MLKRIATMSAKQAEMSGKQEDIDAARADLEAYEEHMRQQTVVDQKGGKS